MCVRIARALMFRNARAGFAFCPDKFSAAISVCDDRYGHPIEPVVQARANHREDLGLFSANAAWPFNEKARTPTASLFIAGFPQTKNE
jgi:hypothetical protein